MAQLAPGVVGTVEDAPELLLLRFIRATEPGSGAVGAYLDQLPTDRRVCARGVFSPRLAEMLARRGFTRDGLDMVREASG